MHLSVIFAALALSAVVQAQDSGILGQQRNRGGTGGRGGQGNQNQTPGQGRGQNNNTDSNTGGDRQASLTLDSSQIQSNLANDGQDQQSEGQIPSLTSTNNFINFCLTRPDLQLTNGQQIKEGSCNPTPMGVIVAQDKMPSAKFQFPKNLEVIAPNQDFDIVMKISNLVTGAFVNPQTNYYAAPGQTNSAGIAIGHSHFTVQKVASIDSTELLDSAIFAFFKGVNGPADAQGNVRATVTGGLPEGDYRLTSINTYSNHQPILGAVAQRGALDDTVYFSVRADAAENNDDQNTEEGQEDGEGQANDGQQLDNEQGNQAGGQNDGAGQNNTDGQQNIPGQQGNNGQTGNPSQGQGQGQVQNRGRRGRGRQGDGRRRQGTQRRSHLPVRS